MTLSRELQSQGKYTSFADFTPQQSETLEISKAPIRLSVLTQFFPPDFAATGQLIEELVKQLGGQGVDVQVFTGQPGYAFESSEAPKHEKRGHVEIQRSRVTRFWSKRMRGAVVNGLLFAIRSIFHVLANCRSRNLLLVTTAPPFLPVIGYILNLLIGLPYICLLYDIYPDIAIKLDVISQDNWIAKLWLAINIQVWRRAKEIIVLSPNMKQLIINHCPEVADKIQVIHSWSDPKAIKPIAKENNWFAHKHQLVDSFTVLYSGNMGRCHDMDTIFEAALELRDEPIKFVFIGDGAKRTPLMEKVEKHGLNNFVFLPYQNKEDLPYSLTACDLSLVSMDEEMEEVIAPSKLYGCLASGRPIAAVCPQSTYIRDMLEEGQCGQSFSNGDSKGLADFILHLSKNSDVAKNMGLSARQDRKSVV